MPGFCTYHLLVPALGASVPHLDRVSRLVFTTKIVLIVIVQISSRIGKLSSRKTVAQGLVIYQYLLAYVRAF
jgi:hypothetical protein